MSDNMSDNLGQQITQDAAATIEGHLKRLRLHLREAEVQAPMQVFQMIEELRNWIASDTDKARKGLLDALKRFGASEEEFLDWLQLDLQQLERKLLNAISQAADPSRVDLAAWRKAPPYADKD